jgi:hypothetical protein
MSHCGVFRSRLFHVRVFLAAVVALLVSASLSAEDSVRSIRIVVLAGEGAIQRPGRDSVRLPTIRVEDENGRPVNEADVLFLLPDGGAGGAFSDGATTARTRTNPLGLAAVRAFRLNKIAGEFQIRVEAAWHGQRATGTIRQISEPQRGAGKKIAIISAVAAGGVGLAVAAARGKDNGTCCAPPPCGP